MDGILASDYHGDISMAAWPFVRLYVEARYRVGLPVIPIGRGHLRLSWPINLLDRAGAPLLVKHAFAPLIVASCILTELVNVAVEHLPALIGVVAATSITLMAARKLARAGRPCGRRARRP